MADFMFKGYDNFILAEKIDSLIDTKLDVNKFMTTNYELVTHPGMQYKVHRYVGSGNAEHLARGDGNTQWIDADYVETIYTAERNQDKTRFYDDDAMTDPTLIDSKLQFLAEEMLNLWTEDAIREFDKTTRTFSFPSTTPFTLGSFARYINQYVRKYEGKEGLFILCSVNDEPMIQTMLGDDLKYVESYIRNGAIGTVLGVPIYSSKVVNPGVMYLATKDAVTAFIKKGTYVESERDIETKFNKVVATRYAIIALVNDDKCIKGTFPSDSGIEVPEATADQIKVTARNFNAWSVNGKNVAQNTVTGDAEMGTVPGKYAMLTLADACPVGTYKIKQINPALKYFYDLGDTTITINGDGEYVKEKEYTLAAADDFKFLVGAGSSNVRIWINGVYYYIGCDLKFAN